MEEVRIHAQDVDRVHKICADRDRGDSRESDYWQKRGRERFDVDETRVIDFIEYILGSKIGLMRLNYEGMA